LSATKVIFVGNIFGGDDGIGPYLYNELKNHPDLQKYELLELGVIGLDLLSFVEEGDTLIIVDAVHSQKKHGKVILLEEKDLSKDIKLLSQHDFGVEQTVALLRASQPELKKMSIIGIQVGRLRSFSDTLSDEILKKLPQIKKDVVNFIIQIADSN